MLGKFLLRCLGLGFLSWAVPFAASIAFFDSSGTLLIAQPLFKSLMVVIGGGSGLLLLLLLFWRNPPTPLTGAAVGTLWFVLNIALDVTVLLPMQGTAFGPYFHDIGLRYLLLPMMGWALGVAATRLGDPKPPYPARR